MNKELREEMEYLITCDDKAITPDVKDDVEMTLDYIDKLEEQINKAIEYIEKNIIYDTMQPNRKVLILPNELLDILRGKDNER